MNPLLLLSVAALVAAPKPPDWPTLLQQLRSPTVSAAARTAALERFAAGSPPTLRMAVVFRALDSASPAPPGTFTHRVSLEECTALTAVLRRSPALLPGLSCDDVARWQTKLDEGFRTTKVKDARAMARVVSAEASEGRDTIDAMLSLNRDPEKYFTQLFQVPPAEGAKVLGQLRAVRELLFELVAEADLLDADGGGKSAAEEFSSRYPSHPFAASALFAAGQFETLRARFPGHRLVSQPQPK
jgi:hypothetical protein